MISYVLWRTLQRRSAVDPLPPQQVQKPLLVGPSVLHFYSHETDYGEDSTMIYPAFYGEERCWVRRDVWFAAEGYSATGTSDSILSFEDGVKLFLEHDMFAFPYPEERNNS